MRKIRSKTASPDISRGITASSTGMVTARPMRTPEKRLLPPFLYCVNAPFAPPKEKENQKVRESPMKAMESVSYTHLDVYKRQVQRDEIERGQVLSAPGSIHPHTHFNSSVYVLKKEEGGRHTPFFNGYRPQFYFRTTDVTGVIELPGGTEMVMPGDNIEMEIKLITPIAIEEGRRCAIREGGRTVGSGVVSGVID